MSESEEEEDESASSSATGLMDVDYGEQEPEPEPERPSTSASDSAVSGIPPENTAAKHPPLRVRLKLSGLRTVMSAASTPNAASTPDPEMSNLRINGKKQRTELLIDDLISLTQKMTNLNRMSPTLNWNQRRKTKRMPMMVHPRQPFLLV
jgi:hypothetical protein